MPFLLQPDQTRALARTYIAEFYGELQHWSDVNHYEPYIVWAMAPGDSRVVPHEDEPIGYFLDRVYNLYADEFHSMEMNP